MWVGLAFVISFLVWVYCPAGCEGVVRSKTDYCNIFFSCVGTKAPPAAKMPWGFLSRKKGTVLFKSIKN